MLSPLNTTRTNTLPHSKTHTSAFDLHFQVSLGYSSLLARPRRTPSSSQLLDASAFGRAHLQTRCVCRRSCNRCDRCSTPQQGAHPALQVRVFVAECTVHSTYMHAGRWHAEWVTSTKCADTLSDCVYACVRRPQLNSTVIEAISGAAGEVAQVTSSACDGGRSVRQT